MGNPFSRSSNDMGEMFKKRQEEMQQKMEMDNKEFMAMRIARKRDSFVWWTAFFGLVSTGLVIRYRKVQKPALLVPLVPIAFLTLYNYDSAYGNKMHRIRKEAQYIMNYESDILQMPHNHWRSRSPFWGERGPMMQGEWSRDHPQDWSRFGPRPDRCPKQRDVPQTKEEPKNV